MPYSGPGDSNLPENVKALPENLKAQWVEVFNSAYKSCNEKGGKDCESGAFAQAWGVVNKHRNKLEQLLTGIKEWAEQLFGNYVDGFETVRSIKKVSAWDGSASNYGDTEKYCNACLINVNDGDPSTWTQEKCMLPIREPGDGSGTYVDKAVHAAAGGHGIGQVKNPGVDSGKWDSAVKAAAKKLISAYSAMDQVAPASVYKCAGMDAPKRSMPVVQVFDSVIAQAMAKDPMAFITDIFTDDNGGLFAVIASNGKLYRANVVVDSDNITLAQDWTEIKVDMPIALSRSTGTISRQKDGRYRLLSISCSSVLNRVGQVDSKALFDSFIEHATQTGEYPIRQFYHAGAAFRTGQVDWIGRDENLLLMSTLYDDTEIAKREINARQKDPSYWGDSIGFDPLDGELVEITNGITIPVYTKGICKEVSTLPENQAAAWYTAAPTVKEVTRMLNDNQFAAFVKFFEGEPDPESAAKAWLEQNSSTRNRAIEENGSITRAADATQSVTEPVVPIVETTVTETPAVVAQDAQPAPTPITNDPVALALQDGPVTLAADYPPAPEQDKPTPPAQSEQPKKPEGLSPDALDQIVNAVLAKLTPLLENLGVEMGKASASNVELSNRVRALEVTEDAKKRAYLQDVSPAVVAAVTNATFRPRDARADNMVMSSDEIAAETMQRCPVKY